MHNGHGPDWAALPLACEWFGITDVQALIQRLLVIKQHSSKKRGTGDGTGDTER